MSQEDLSEKKQNAQLSVYGQGKVSTETFALCTIDIKKAFPKLPISWYDVLESMLNEERFTNERLIDATKSLIKNCQYPEPTLANIISFDKTIKVYLWDELLALTKDYSPESRRDYLNNFAAINYYGEQRYARKDYIERYNLPIWRFEKKLIRSKQNEKLTEEPTENLSEGENPFAKDLATSYKIPGIVQKRLSPEEKEARRKIFEKILEQENHE